MKGNIDLKKDVLCRSYHIYKLNLYLMIAEMMLKMNEFFLLLFQGIHSTDEVNFIQNLVFYVERAYRTPDYELIEHLTLGCGKEEI